MPLQSRISPFGEFFISAARGTLMGNRGGRLHDDAKRLGVRRWASKQWICCRLDFNDRRREVWGHGYTELFFLDEVTAFSAGHRPCFECRRRDAERFAALFAGEDKRATAAAMDQRLHRQRRDGKAKRLHRLPIESLPDGAMFARGRDAFAVRGKSVLPWTPSGYDAPQLRSRNGIVDVLTPPATLDVLARGYAPMWHPSAA